MRSRTFAQGGSADPERPLLRRDAVFAVGFAHTVACIEGSL
jgi:hypothetical protein